MPGLGNGKASKFHGAVSGEHGSYHCLIHINVTGLRFNTLLRFLAWLGGCNLAIYVPEIFPSLILFPQEYIALDETTIALDPRDGLHFFSRERIGDNSSKIAQVVPAIDGERDGNLPALHGPFDANHSRMNIQPLRNLHNHRILDVNSVSFRSDRDRGVRENQSG